jgi:hypothetical protein
VSFVLSVSRSRPDGTGGWRAAFGSFSSPIYMVGRLHALATQITLNDVIEWKPDS